jgi:hypothetical protein
VTVRGASQDFSFCGGFVIEGAAFERTRPSAIGSDMHPAKRSSLIALARRAAAVLQRSAERRRWVDEEIPLSWLDEAAVRCRLLPILSRLPEAWLEAASSWAYQWVSPNHDDYYEERWSRPPLSLLRLATFAWFLKLERRGQHAWLLYDHPGHPLEEDLLRLASVAAQPSSTRPAEGS